MRELTNEDRWEFKDYVLREYVVLRRHEFM
jgi:hypothetical protein